MLRSSPGERVIESTVYDVMIAVAMRRRMMRK